MTNNDVLVSWDQCESGSISGFADDCKYDLQYTLGTGQESYFETLYRNNFNMNIVQGIDYCFRVRAKNSCANGMWSHETCNSVCAKPEQLAPPQSLRENDSEITVSWDTCQAGGNECSDCSVELEIHEGNGNKRIETIYNRSQYSIYNPMSTMPYSFRVRCDSAQCGLGPWSDSFSSSVCTPPVEPVCPVELCADDKLDANNQCRDDKITVQW